MHIFQKQASSPYLSWDRARYLASFMGDYYRGLRGDLFWTSTEIGGMLFTELLVYFVFLSLQVHFSLIIFCSSRIFLGC